MTRYVRLQQLVKVSAPSDRHLAKVGIDFSAKSKTPKCFCRPLKPPPFAPRVSMLHRGIQFRGYPGDQARLCRSPNHSRLNHHRSLSRRLIPARVGTRVRVVRWLQQSRLQPDARFSLRKTPAESSRRTPSGYIYYIFTYTKNFP